MPFRKSKLWSQTKPSVGYGVNWGDPINVGLIGCWLVNEGGGQTLFDIAALNHLVKDAGSSPFTWGAGRFGVAVTPAPTVIDGTFKNPGATQFTICGWAKQSSNTNGCLIHVGSSAGTDGYSLGVGGTTMDNAGTNLIGLIDGVAWNAFGIAVPAGWNFIAFTRNAAGTNTGYVNGVAGPTTFTNAPLAPSSAASLCGDGLVGGRGFVGTFENCRVYNRALNKTEISRLYTEPFAGIVTPRRRIISAAAAGGFSSYWATRGPRTIGAGMI